MVWLMLVPPPQLAQIPVLATINPSHSNEPRRRRGERNPANTIAGTKPTQVASIHGEGACLSSAVVVREMVRVAVVVVPAAPKVIVAGLKEHASPAGNPAHDKVIVFPAAAAFGVNETVNVADCPVATVPVCGEAMSGPPFPNPATFSPVPESAMPNTVLVGVPVLNCDTTLPELRLTWKTVELQKSSVQNVLPS